ncbi:hypothetical protein ANN_22892, partial [Periplaneta americana]
NYQRIPNLTGEQADGITVFRIPPMTSLMLHRCRTGAINLQRITLHSLLFRIMKSIKQREFQVGRALRNARWFESSWGKKFSHEISASVWDRCPPSIVMHLGSYDRFLDSRLDDKSFSTE